MRTMAKIAIINLKGGVGKSVTACNLACLLAEIWSRRVLVMDLDKQSNTTKFFNRFAYGRKTMGDVLTLIEKAQDAQDAKQAQETAKRMLENKFDMNDMLDQLNQMKKMGGAAAMLSMLPGAGSIDTSQIDEREFVHVEAIIQSMTKAEREKPSIINPKRKRRIAAGSGTSVEQVNKLLRQFEMMQKMMKQIKRNPKALGRRLGLPGLRR